MFVRVAAKAAVVAGANRAVRGHARTCLPKTWDQQSRGPTDRRSWQGRRERSVHCTRATEDAARGGENRTSLLPLDGAWRLRGDIEDDAVDLAQLVDHARGDPLEQVVGQPCP